MKFVHKLAVTTVGIALSFTIMEPRPVKAATITYDFTVDVTTGQLSGNQYSGFFSYDDSSPSSSSRLLFSVFDETEFNFEFAGRTYTRRDLRSSCRGLPCGSLSIPGGEVIPGPFGRPIALIPRGGRLTFFGFTTFDRFNSRADSFTLTSTDFNYQRSFTPTGIPSDAGSGTVAYSLRPTSVPEPAIAFGLSALGLGFLLKRKQVADYKAKV